MGIGRGAALAGLLLAGALLFRLLLAIITEDGRAPIPVQDVRVTEGDKRELRLTVPTCQGSPEVDVLSENYRRVVVRVVSDVQNGVTGACLDSARVRLQGQLGDRELIDATTADELWVSPKQRE
jgi:hypothetical protein